MPDLTLHCKDCGDQFVFTEGQQEFFNGKGLTQPRRCEECRKKKRDRNAADDRGESGSKFNSLRTHLKEAKDQIKDLQDLLFKVHKNMEYPETDSIDQVLGDLQKWVDDMEEEGAGGEG